MKVAPASSETLHFRKILLHVVLNSIICLASVIAKFELVSLNTKLSLTVKVGEISLSIPVVFMSEKAPNMSLKETVAKDEDFRVWGKAQSRESAFK